MLETLRNSLVFHAFINEQRGCCVLNEQTINCCTSMTEERPMNRCEQTDTWWITPTRHFIENMDRAGDKTRELSVVILHPLYHYHSQQQHRHRHRHRHLSWCHTFQENLFRVINLNLHSLFIYWFYWWVIKGRDVWTINWCFTQSPGYLELKVKQWYWNLPPSVSQCHDPSDKILQGWISWSWFVVYYIFTKTDFVLMFCSASIITVIFFFPLLLYWRLDDYFP